MKDLDFIKDYIDRNEELFIDLSMKIWNYAELPYEEYKSAKLLQDILEDQGFTINKGLANIDTAFTASFGSGDPVFGFLGEYDALDKLSQKPEVTTKQAIKEGAPGHGCGHNLLGVGSLAAALAVKEYLLTNNKEGRVIYFGCPAEEGNGSKQFMVADGVFDDVDFVYTWHPSTKNEVQSNRSVAIMGADFEFKGKSSHAGNSPHLGRSALDAGELTSVGVNYLREHMEDQERIHYAYLDAGGISPNVVQDYCLVKYEVRATTVKGLKVLFERLVNVAKGAALMTDTSLEYEIKMQFSDYITNSALAKVADQALKDIGPPDWDEKDYKLAREYQKSYGDLNENESLDSSITSFDPNNKTYSSGSTDVGDVAYAVPTLNFYIATACLGNIGHTWQMTGQSGSRIGNKGMLTAAKAMALSAIRTMDRDDIIQEAKEIVEKQRNAS